MTSDFAKAIVAAVDDFDCDIINVSSGDKNSDTLRLAIDYVAEKGAVIVSSVGNSGNSRIYPKERPTYHWICRKSIKSFTEYVVETIILVNMYL